MHMAMRMATKCHNMHGQLQGLFQFCTVLPTAVLPAMSYVHAYAAALHQHSSTSAAHMYSCSCIQQGAKRAAISCSTAAPQNCTTVQQLQRGSTSTSTAQNSTAALQLLGYCPAILQLCSHGCPACCAHVLALQQLCCMCCCCAWCGSYYMG